MNQQKLSFMRRKALKCKTLGAELVHAYSLYSVSTFYIDDHLPTLNVRRYWSSIELALW